MATGNTSKGRYSVHSKARETGMTGLARLGTEKQGEDGAAAAEEMLELQKRPGPPRVKAARD